MQANGQYQQTGQLQLTHPHVNYNANGVNQGYENNASYNGMGALDNHYTMHKMGVSIQQQNNYVPLHKPPQSSHQQYYPNPAQKSSSQRNTPVALNQQMMPSQRTSVSVNPHAAVRDSNVVYYQSQVCPQKTLNQSSKPVENVSVPRTNRTTSSSMQHVRVTQQSSVHSPVYGQMFQHATPPPYTQHINSTFSNVPNAQNIQLRGATPATSLSTSNVNKVAANNPRVQNPCYVSQTSDNGTVHSVNGSANVSSQLVTNNANSQAIFLPALCLTQFTPIKNVQQMSVGGSINVKLAQSVLLATDYKELNTSSAPLPSQTCLQKQISVESNVNDMRTASQQITKAAKDHSVNRVDNSMFYHKMNDVSHSLRLSQANQAPELNRCEALTKIDTVSSAQAKDCSLQVSPGRAKRAVAVVLPLSQDGSPSKHSSASSVQSTNPASDCFFHFKLKKTPDAFDLKKLLRQSTSNGSNVSADNANAQASSPSPNSKQSSVDGETVKVAHLPLTFAHLVEGKVPAIVSKERKSKSGNGKVAAGQKPCGEELSSLPATKWTLRMLQKRIEFEDNEKKTDMKPSKHSSATQIILHYWNGDCKALLNCVKTGTLSNKLITIREFCSKIDLDMDTVILSQNQNSNLSRYHVLSDGEVYQEKGSYTSCWLNINQKLDDIDKEFGLPWFLRSSRDDGTSVDTELRSKPEDNSQTKVDLAKPEELNKDSSNPTCSSPSATSSSSSTDSEMKNELAHLDPEIEEKAEEIKCASDAQSNDSSYSFKIEVLPPEEAKVIFTQMECDSLPTVDMAVSEEAPPNEEDEVKKVHISPLENYCCMEKWKEKVLGLSSEGKCKCGEQSQDEERAVKLEIQNDWALGPVDLTEDDDDYFPLFPQESDNADEDQKPIKSLITVSSESDNESQVSDNNHSTPSDHHHKLEQDSVTESEEDVSTNKNTEDENASSQPVGVSDDVKENDTRLASDSPDPVQRPLKLNKLKSYLKTQTIFESFSKSKISGRVETAELALFGSMHKNTASESGQQSHLPSSRTLTHSSSEKTLEAPKRLYVKFNPSAKSNKQEAEPSGKDSVRKRIHENWRNSFPLATIRLKRKNKKFAIVSANHGTTIHLSSIKRKDKRVGSKRKSQDSNNGQCHKKKRVCVDERAMTTTQKPVDAEARPLQENVLKFNVLPNTFNFKEGSRDTDSKPDSKADEKIAPVSAEGSPCIVPAEGGSKGAWCDESTTNSTPQSTASVLESTGLFQEFQRRFKMRQASTED